MSVVQRQAFFDYGEVNTPTVMETVIQGTASPELMTRIQKRGAWEWLEEKAGGAIHKIENEVGNVITSKVGSAIVGAVIAIYNPGLGLAAYSMLNGYGRGKEAQEEARAAYNKQKAEYEADPEGFMSQQQQLKSSAVKASEYTETNRTKADGMYDSLIAKLEEERVKSNVSVEDLKAVVDSVGRNVPLNTSTLSQAMNNILTRDTSLAPIIAESAGAYSDIVGNIVTSSDRTESSTDYFNAETTREYEQFTEMFGKPLQNLADFYDGLTADNLAAGDKAHLRTAFAEANKSITKTMSQRGILDSGLYDDATIKGAFKYAEASAGIDSKASERVREMQTKWVGFVKNMRPNLMNTVTAASNTARTQSGVGTGLAGTTTNATSTANTGDTNAGHLANASNDTAIRGSSTVINAENLTSQVDDYAKLFGQFDTNVKQGTTQEINAGLNKVTQQNLEDTNATAAANQKAGDKTKLATDIAKLAVTAYGVYNEPSTGGYTSTPAVEDSDVPVMGYTNQNMTNAPAEFSLFDSDTW